MRVYNVSFPIFVTQTYFNQGSSQTQIGNGAVEDRKNNATVEMVDFRWENFTGTVNTFQPGDGSCVTDVSNLSLNFPGDALFAVLLTLRLQPFSYHVGLPNLSHTGAIIVEYNTNASCKGFEMSNIEVFPQNLEAPSVM